MQYAENLSDRQAADAVVGRIDWKYALSLELTDPGFDYSVLSEFRQRLLDEFTDIDILAFVPQISYDTVYEGYRQAVEVDEIKVLNPDAFKYNEFPLTFIPSITGHYEVKTFEEV